ncbi:transglycosylase domain-containing protein [Synechococcus sp. H55.11]|uniref:transglycosylase domain-containing protein n=1 Tax=unclassified Synechococcus TaxID=2626047 RepID=UPI0039C1993A
MTYGRRRSGARGHLSPRLGYGEYAGAAPPTRPSWRAQVAATVGNLLLGSLLLGSTATAAGLMGLAISFRNLPDVHQLRDYVPVATTHIVDIRGEPIASLHGEANREVISLDEVSPEMKKALLAIEDSHFYTHPGINPVSLGRALLGSVEGGLGSAGGGSTLTMQLVKNLFLRPERTLSRKVAEVVLAVRLEQVFTKDEILEMYLNQVYWGHNLYGIQAAARSYFNKDAAELNLAEAAMLAGILPAPETLSPFRNLEGAKRRQRLVLDRLVELKWITPEEAQAAREQELTLGRITSFQSNAPAVTDVIEAELRRRYGEQAILQGGLRVQATIDLRLQRLAERIVNEDGPRIGAARRADQMALAAVDPRTGYVKALVGGINAQRGQFNRATQAFRQTGSTFKPYVYYAALASGRYSPGSILEDTPVTYPGSPPYSPKNYDNTFYGPLTFARALELSRNVPTVKLADEVGIRNVIAAAQATGISAEMFPNLATALGSASISPLEMAASYAVFANGGYRVEPTFLAQVVDRNGQILFEAKPQPQQVLDPWAVATLNQILKGVVTQGTGTAARLDDGRPVAGKTGTTSDFRDAWFIGYVPQLSTAIWIGNDNNSPMLPGTAGGAFVAPTWKRFMAEALQGIPPQDFPSPQQFSPPRP